MRTWQQRAACLSPSRWSLDVLSLPIQGHLTPEQVQFAADSIGEFL